MKYLCKNDDNQFVLKLPRPTVLHVLLALVLLNDKELCEVLLQFK